MLEGSADEALLTWLRDQGSPRLEAPPGEPGAVYLRVGTGISLWIAGEPPRGPLAVDPTRGALERRLRTFHRGNLLARAIGVHRGVTHIVDATAGLGGDGFCLAAIGCRVTLLERHPALALLLLHAHRQLSAGDQRSRAIAERVTIHAEDAIPFVSSMPAQARPEVVFLDPMYPERRKSALPRGEMVLLHALVGPALDELELLATARRVASRHVVVKRPHGAPPLEPDVLRVYRSKMVRFDVYAPFAT